MTVYKVVADQMRISQGWVKCGQCGDIFDATLHLVQTSTETQAKPIELLDHAAVEILSETPAEIPGGEDSGDDQLGVEPETLSELKSETEKESSILNNLPSVEGTLQEDIPIERVSFLQRVDLSSFWHRKVVKLVLSLIAFVLFLGLGGQWIYHERDRLAALHPEWKNVLQVFCDSFRCSVGPLKQIESIAIEAVSFKKIDANSFRLSLTIKNLANLVLALPSIELTLTNLQDQVIIRRVLLPQELGTSQDRLAPTTEWPVSVVIGVETESKATGVVGYRLLAFYP